MADIGHLVCTRCRRTWSVFTPQTYCPDCGVVPSIEWRSGPRPQTIPEERNP